MTPTRPVQDGQDPAGLRHGCREAELELVQAVLPGVDPRGPVADVHAHGADHEHRLHQGRLLDDLHGVGAEGGEGCVLEHPLQTALRQAERSEGNPQAGEESHQHEDPNHFQSLVDLSGRVGQRGQNTQHEHEGVARVGTNEPNDGHDGLLEV